jgi:single-strand DNA-binding protein
MAKGFNKVVVLGNLTRDPELRATPNGQNVASFSLAVNRSWKNAQGETQEAVDYFDCVAWGKAGELISQYMQKGRAILVSGRLSSRSWEQDGQKRSKVEIVVEDFNFIGEGSGRGSDSASAPAASSAKASPAKKDNDEVVIEDIDDEPVDLSDIPF